MSFLRLGYKKLWPLFWSQTVSLWCLFLGGFDEAIFHAVSYNMERSTWQGTESSPWSATSEKLRPSLELRPSVQQLVRNTILSATLWVSLEADPSPCRVSRWDCSACQHLDCSTVWVPGSWPQKLWDNKYRCFELLRFGMICYAAVDN